MKKLASPVRVNSILEIGPYTFTKSDGSAIDLTAYSTVKVELKLKGEVYSTEDATFIVKGDGTVHLASYTFDTVGKWMAQFYCVDGSSNDLFGEPIRFTVVENVEDAAINEILEF